MHKIWSKIKKTDYFYMLPGDIFIIVFVLLAAAAMLALFALRNINADGKKTAVIYLGGEVYERVDLSRDGNITLNQNGAEMTFEISDGGLCVAESNCANRQCVKTGRINKRYQIIACVPNHVYVTIESENDEYDFDAVIG